MIQPPNELTVAGPEAKHLGWLNKFRAFAIRLRVLESPDIGVKEASNGIFLFIKNKAAGGKAGMIFRGQWTAGAYNEQDVVVVPGGGASAGSYVCVKSGATSAPSSGSPDWVQLAPANITGRWL
jgi:hypothetical protein